jgi:hypothetical protein
MEFDFSQRMTFLATPGNRSDAETRRDYILKYFEAQGAVPSPADLESMVAPAAEPMLVDREKMLNACTPLGQDIAARMEWQLIQRIGKEWHVPAGEQILQNTVGVLAAGYFGCRAGNLVVIRRTDRATIAFLLPHLVVDVETLQLRSTPGAAPVAVGAADNGNATFEECMRTALETLSTLAFALPEPWGIITSAGLGLIAAFLPDSGPNPFDQLEKDLISFQKNTQLGSIAQDGNALTHWINVQLAAWRNAERQGGSNDLTSQIDRWESELDKFMEGGTGTVYNDLQQIQRGDLSSEEAALAVFLMTISAFLAGQKFTILLDGLRASIAKTNGDTAAFNKAVIQWRISYNTLVIQLLGDKQSAIVGFAALIDNWIGRRVAERLSKISAVRRFDYQFPPAYVSKYGPPQGGHIENAYDWRDDADGGTRSYYPDEHCNWMHTDCTYQTYGDKANSEHNAHVQAVQGQLDQKYDALRKTVRGWQSVMLQWSNNMPPGPAHTAPTIDATSWKSGEEPSWKGHTDVQYAVAFGNAKGPGELSPWSARETIKGIDPKVTIEVDQMKQATKRWVFRQFDGKTDTLQCIFVMDNTTDYFVDDASRKWVNWKLEKMI